MGCGEFTLTPAQRLADFLHGARLPDPDDVCTATGKVVRLIGYFDSEEGLTVGFVSVVVEDLVSDAAGDEDSVAGFDEESAVFGSSDLPDEEPLLA
jgi:hypothetical protein